MSGGRGRPPQRRVTNDLPPAHRAVLPGEHLQRPLRRQRATREMGPQICITESSIERQLQPLHAMASQPPLQRPAAHPRALRRHEHLTRRAGQLLAVPTQQPKHLIAGRIAAPHHALQHPPNSGSQPSDHPAHHPPHHHEREQHDASHAGRDTHETTSFNDREYETGHPARAPSPVVSATNADALTAQPADSAWRRSPRHHQVTPQAADNTTAPPRGTAAARPQQGAPRHPIERRTPCSPFPAPPSCSRPAPSPSA